MNNRPLQVRRKEVSPAVGSNLTWGHMEILQQLSSYGKKRKTNSCHKHPLIEANVAAVEGSTPQVFEMKLNGRTDIGVVTDFRLIFESKLGIVHPFQRSIGYSIPSSIDSLRNLVVISPRSVLSVINMRNFFVVSVRMGGIITLG